MAIVEYIKEKNQHISVMKKVIDYCVQDFKVYDEKSKQRLMSGINCNGENAFNEFMLTKNSYKDLSNYDWYCDNCDASLDEQTGFNVNCGSWTCTECGETNFIDESEIIDDDYDDYGDDDIPEGCVACGGSYPNCMTSCPIFDD